MAYGRRSGRQDWPICQPGLTRTNCGADPSGRVRGRRNVMLDDSDVHWHRQIKACVGGVVAAVTGDPAVFVSVGAVHQGPPGGGPVVAVVDMSADNAGWPQVRTPEPQ